MSNDNQLLKSFKDILSFDNSTKAYTTNATVVKVDGSTAWVHISGGVDETPAVMAVSAKPGDTVQLKIENGVVTITGNISSPPTDNSVAYRAVDMVEEANQVINAVNQHFWTDTNGVHVTENEQDSNPANQGKNVVFNSEGMLFRNNNKNLALYSDNGMAIYDGTENSNPVAEFTKDGISMSRNGQKMLSINPDATVIGVTDVLNGLVMVQDEPAEDEEIVSPVTNYILPNQTTSIILPIEDGNGNQVIFDANAIADINLTGSIEYFGEVSKDDIFPFIEGQSINVALTPAVGWVSITVTATLVEYNSKAGIELSVSGTGGLYGVNVKAVMEVYKYGSAPKITISGGGESTFKCSKLQLKDTTIHNFTSVFENQEPGTVIFGEYDSESIDSPVAETQGFVLSIKNPNDSYGAQIVFNDKPDSAMYKRSYYGGNWRDWVNVYSCPIPVNGAYLTTSNNTSDKPVNIWPGTGWTSVTSSISGIYIWKRTS